ncbi:chemotaxis-specific protein-glutamate methyltransferase CheB [Dongia deserti]|uniref:chemotaxis-specific protein-glutamate methyltransferase CheB n=1 Tax=Dongia deserti TaxID=2268030 RepID=UPI000E64F57E|nr:chemotaxis-specific protein-glutamate methyltransferase CheB [Dongia deserti]
MGETEDKERRTRAGAVKVLVVEDSPTVRALLVELFSSDPSLRVVGVVSDGDEALAAVLQHRPDVVTMDIHMPRMNGLTATRQIMETAPVPIVIITGSSEPESVAVTFDAMEAGALTVLPRPTGLGHPDHAAMARELIQTVKLMSEVKVVRRWSVSRPRAAGGRASASAGKEGVPRLVAIGASTGGPPALHTILSSLPKTFPLPIVIVQHMASGFIGGFVDWLRGACRLDIRVGIHGEVLAPGRVYVAPDERHMTVAKDGTIVLTTKPPMNGIRPAVSALFRSVAETYGGDAIAGLLTGMGRDGAEELRLLKEAGAVTFVQDKDSSAVHGMPGEAIKLDAAMFVLPPEKIAAMLLTMTSGGAIRAERTT